MGSTLGSPYLGKLPFRGQRQLANERDYHHFADFPRHGGVEAFLKPSLGILKVLLKFNSERHFKKGLKVEADGGDPRPASKSLQAS